MSKETFDVTSQPELPGVPDRVGPYTAADLVKVEQITTWLEANKKSRAWLGKKASLPGSTLSQILGRKYASSPSEQLDRMLSVLQTETERMRDGTPGYVRGSMHKLMQVVCERTRKHANFGIVTGYVGVGKTRTAKEYCQAHPMTLFVEAAPRMTPNSLMSSLLAQLNVAVPRGECDKFDELRAVLKGTNYLILVDEAEKVSSSAMEYLRRLRDIAGVGVVLIGTEKLTTLIKPQHGQFDQIRSRVSMWPATVEAITRDDADDMVRAAMADQGELPDDVFDTLWAYCAGSARVLNESLLAAVRDYGVGRHPITAPLVHKIAQTVLFMAPARVEGARA